MTFIRRYQRMLYPGNALKEAANVAPLRELANLAFAPVRKRVRPPSSERYTIKLVPNFDEAFEDLWQRAREQWPCAVIRGSRYLKWQFRQQPGKAFDVLGLFDGQKLRGYAVLFFRKPEPRGAPSKAAISDLCYDAGDGETDAGNVIDELLNAALQLAMERRAGSLVTDVLDPRIESRLKHLGFWRIKRSPEFMVYSPDQHEVMYQPANWFLTRADSDVSIFEDSNL